MAKRKRTVRQTMKRLKNALATAALCGLFVGMISICGCESEEPAEPTAEQLEEERLNHKANAQRELQDMGN